MTTGSEAQMMKNRIALYKIVTILQYLGFQGLAVRGKSDNDSNLIALLQERKNDVPELVAWLNRDKKYKWWSHDIFNEILQDLSKAVQRGLVRQMKEVEYFRLMIDETSDDSSKEQIRLCFRIFSQNYDLQELFLGFYDAEITSSESIFATVKDVLMRIQFSLNKCRSQCYDGAANMSGNF